MVLKIGQIGYWSRKQDMSILFMMDLCGSFAAVITESVAAVKSFIQVKHDPFDDCKRGQDGKNGQVAIVAVVVMKKTMLEMMTDERLVGERRKQRARVEKNNSSELTKTLRQVHEVGHVLKNFMTIFDFRTTIYDHHLV